MEVYARVRRAVQVDGMSVREAAREFGLSRKTIRKMLRYSAPPGYQRKAPVRRPKLGPWLDIIDQILEDDESRLKKQRHTARRIYERLREEHAFTGGYTIVKDYVRDARLRHKEVFVPLVHPPGDAQADFGEALVVIGGVEQKAHFLCVDLPHSDDCFVMAFPAENTESFCEGHAQAFAYFGGVPRTILYDNTKIAVAEITGDGERKTTEEFSRLKSHYLFDAKFGRPGKGNDKGNVEGLVGYARRSYAREEMIFDPLHYLALLEQKTRALDQSTACVGTEIGRKGMMVAAKSLALSAAELMTKPELLKQAKEESGKAMTGVRYVSMVPEGRPAAAHGPGGGQASIRRWHRRSANWR